MKKPAWSHSSLKDFEGCQRRYHEVKVLKKYPFQETEATRYGNQVHKAIEDYIGEGKPIPAEYSQFQPVVDAMIKKNGRKLAEYEMALTVDLKPTGWKDKDVWVLCERKGCFPCSFAWLFHSWAELIAEERRLAKALTNFSSLHSSCFMSCSTA